MVTDRPCCDTILATIVFHLHDRQSLVYDASTIFTKGVCVESYNFTFGSVDSEYINWLGHIFISSSGELKLVLNDPIIMQEYAKLYGSSRDLSHSISLTQTFDLGYPTVLTQIHRVVANIRKAHHIARGLI